MLVPELGISQGQYGILSSLLFVSAAIAALGVGRMADVLSLRTQMVLNFGGAAIALVLAAIGPAYYMLIAAVIVGGLTQSIATPTTNRVILQYVDPRRHATWIGVKQSGVQASQFFVGLMVPIVAVIASWTAAAFGLALLSCLLLAWSWRLLPLEAPSSRRSRGRAMETSRQNPKTVRLPPYVWFMALVAFLAGAGTQATNVYLSLFAVNSLSMDPVAAGLALTVSGGLGIVCRIGWGKLLGRGAGPNVVLFLVSCGSVAAMVSMICAATLGSAGWYWVGVAFHGSCVLATNVVINTALLKGAEHRVIGRVTGAVSMGMYSGFAVGPVAMGGLVDVTGSYLLGWTLVAGAYCTLVILLAAFLFIRHRESRR